MSKTKRWRNGSGLLDAFILENIKVETFHQENMEIKNLKKHYVRRFGHSSGEDLKTAEGRNRYQQRYGKKLRELRKEKIAEFLQTLEGVDATTSSGRIYIQKECLRFKKENNFDVFEPEFLENQK